MKSFSLACFLIVSILYTIQAFSQIVVTQTIRGVVRDQVLHQPIPGANVVVLNTDPILGNTTEADGKFKLTGVPLGRQSIQISFIGFTTRTISNIQVGSGKEVVLEIDLEESINQLEELTITVNENSSAAVNDMSLASSRSFTAEETKRFPASLGDPLRLAASFAGTANTDDKSNEIIIRGNTPRGILWKLEGVEIPSPNHFSSEGAASGGVSMFSTQVISRSDFFTSAFSPEYGNATAGVFDIHLRNGNNERHERTIQAGFLGLDVSAEGPISKKSGSSYLFNYRYSTLAMLSQMGLEVQDDGENNTFQDLSFKFNLPLKKAGMLSIFGLSGLSSSLQVSTNEDDREDYDLGVLGLSHAIGISDKTLIKTTLSIMGTKSIDNLSTPTSGFSNTKTFLKAFQRVMIQGYHKVNVRTSIESGLTISGLSYDFLGRVINPASGTPFDDFETFNENGNSGTQQAYLSWKHRPTEKFVLVGGMHSLRFQLTGEISIEPRASIQYQRTINQAITISYGLHSRIESLEYYFGNFIEADGSQSRYNQDLKLTKAHHFVLGLDQAINSQTRFRAEVYYQHLFNVPVLANTLSGGAYSSLNFTSGYTQADLTNQGKGKNYGLEMTLERKFRHNYYYLATASVYESTFQGSDKETRNTRFNGNFAFNLLGGKEFAVGSKGATFGINAKAGWAGNKRFVPIDVAASQVAGREIRDVAYAFEQRYPDHVRFDIQLNYRKNGRHQTSEWRLDIQNITNRRNVLGDYYSNGTVLYEKGLGVVPVLSYRLEF